MICLMRGKWPWNLLLNGWKIRFLIQKPPKDIEKLDFAAFHNNKALFFELIATPQCNALEIVLMAQMTHCLKWGDALHLRKDRTALVVIYDNNVGTIAGAHFHKTCRNRCCGYTQYYGYHTLKGSTQVFANTACLTFFSLVKLSFQS